MGGHVLRDWPTTYSSPPYGRGTLSLLVAPSPSAERIAKKPPRAGALHGYTIAIGMHSIPYIKYGRPNATARLLGVLQELLILVDNM